MEEHIDSGFMLMSSDYHNGDNIPQHNTSKINKCWVAVDVVTSEATTTNSVLPVRGGALHIVQEKFYYM